MEGVVRVDRFRIFLNVLLAAGLCAGGVCLLGQESFFLANRQDPAAGVLFRGYSLHGLALGLILLGGFAAVVGGAWARGTLPMPERNELRPHPSYKGMLIIRFWYLVVPAFFLILLAFWLAEKVPGLPAG